MMKYYEPKHFDVRELVSQDVYAALGEKSILVMDYRILKTADTIRDYFGQPVTINTWHIDGLRSFSGYRSALCNVGAIYSQHRFGRAIDCLIKDVNASKARKEIMKNQKHFPYITVMEDDVSWLHVDCRCVKNQSIVLFNT